MKRKLFVSAVLSALLATAVPGVAQSPVYKIPLPAKKYPIDLQVAKADSGLFVSFKLSYAGYGANLYKTYLIKRDGTLCETNVPELEDKLVVGITSDSNFRYYHYIERQKKLFVLGALKENLSTGEKLLSPSTIVANSILGFTCNDTSLTVYSYEKKSYTLQVTVKTNETVASQSNYNLSFDFSRFRNSDVCFLPEGTAIEADQAIAHVKMFVNRDHITLVHDDPYREMSNGVQNFFKTVVIDIDCKSGEILNRMIPETSRSQFRSYAFDKHLYKIVSEADAFSLHVFDIETGALLYQKKIGSSASEKGYPVYQKNQDPNFSSTKTITLEEMTKTAWLCVPYVIVQEGEDSNVVITLGTFLNEKTGAVVPGRLSAIDLIGSALGTAIMQMGPASGITRFFFMSGSPNSGLKLDDRHLITTVADEVDAFELVHNEKDFKRIKLFAVSNGVVGVYQRKDDSSLWLVPFN